VSVAKNVLSVAKKQIEKKRTSLVNFQWHDSNTQ